MSESSLSRQLFRDIQGNWQDYHLHLFCAQLIVLFAVSITILKVCKSSEPMIVDDLVWKWIEFCKITSILTLNYTHICNIVNINLPQHCQLFFLQNIHCGMLCKNPPQKIKGSLTEKAWTVGARMYPHVSSSTCVCLYLNTRSLQIYFKSFFLLADLYFNDICLVTIFLPGLRTLFTFDRSLNLKWDRK